MNGERIYVRLCVSVTGNKTPKEMRDALEYKIRRYFVPEYHTDIEVEIDEHSGTCQPEYCGENHEVITGF